LIEKEEENREEGTFELSLFFSGDFFRSSSDLQTLLRENF
jgi:hypothetical protein